MVGLQGSGKSTWVSRHLSGTHAVVSKDHWPRARRREARQRRIVAELLASGARVVVDNTNPAPEDRAALIAAAREAGVPVRAVWMDTPAEVCLARNDARQDRARVPLQVRVRDAGPLRSAHDRRGLRPGGRRHDGGDLEHGRELADRRVVAYHGQRPHVVGGLPDGREQRLDGVVVDPPVGDRRRPGTSGAPAGSQGLDRPTGGGDEHPVRRQPGPFEPAACAA
jgi:hypothetical protein